MSELSKDGQFEFQHYGAWGGLGTFLSNDLYWALHEAFGKLGITMVKEVRGVSLDGIRTTHEVPKPGDRMLGYLCVNEFYMPNVPMVWDTIVADIAVWRTDIK